MAAQAVAQVLVSTQHAAEVAQTDVQAYVREALLPAALDDWHRDGAEVLVNPTGSFVEAGLSSDTESYAVEEHPSLRTGESSCLGGSSFRCRG